MDSPMSGLIAEVVLQRLEKLVFAVIFPKFCKLYVDDTFVIIKQDNLSAFHQRLNTTLPGISFTMETATENNLPFLDKTPIRDVRNISGQKGHKCCHRPPQG